VEAFHAIAGRVDERGAHGGARGGAARQQAVAAASRLHPPPARARTVGSPASASRTDPSPPQLLNCACGRELHARVGGAGPTRCEGAGGGDPPGLAREKAAALGPRGRRSSRGGARYL
jgi:hypothetical protein